MNRVAIFIGSLTDPNVKRVVRNLGWMLGETFDLDLISTNYQEYHLEAYDRVFGGRFPDTWLGSIKSLDHYLEDNYPDALVHTNRPQVHGNLVATFGKLHDVTTVYRYGGDTFNLYRVARGPKRIPYFLMNNIVGRSPLFLADEFITLGPHGREQLVSRGVPRSDVSILPPTIDTSQFDGHTSADLDVPDHRSVVLYVGRRTYLKGIQTIEAKLPEVLERRDDLHFLFVGKGRDPVLDRRWHDHVTVIGEVDPREVPSYLGAADVLIHPSLIEGLPRVLVEALAADTSVIARDVGEISTATDNLFVSDDQLVELLLDFESLPVDPATPFSREALKQRYIDYFDGICG